MEPIEIKCEAVDWNYLALNRDQWRARLSKAI